MAMVLPVAALLLPLLAHSVVSGSTCYNAYGFVSNFFVCNTTAAVSTCCNNVDFCMDNGLCLNGGDDNSFTLQGCTDENWSAPCNRLCTGPIGSKPLPSSFFVSCDLRFISWALILFTMWTRSLMHDLDPLGFIHLWMCTENRFCCGTDASCCSSSTSLASVAPAKTLFHPQGASSSSSTSTSGPTGSGGLSAPASPTPASPSPPPSPESSSGSTTARNVGLGVGIPLGLALCASLVVIAMQVMKLRKLRRDRGFANHPDERRNPTEYTELDSRPKLPAELPESYS